MAYKIEEIEGVGPTYANKLELADIKSTDDLLNKCASKNGRQDTAELTAISETLLLKWANMADLMRVKGVGQEFSELLEVSGVDTIKELRHRNADNLTAKMMEINEAKNLTRALPSSSQVEKWIIDAKTLKPMITH